MLGLAAQRDETAAKLQAATKKVKVKKGFTGGQTYQHKPGLAIILHTDYSCDSRHSIS